MARAVDIIAAYGIENADALVRACKALGLEVAIGAALMEKESNGRNVYGHDRGGVFSTEALGKPPGNRVTKENYQEFRRRIAVPGSISNGVGPAQITWKPFFADADRRGMDLSDPSQNMQFGFDLFDDYLYNSGGDVVEAGRVYNNSLAYGIKLNEMVQAWRNRLRGATLETTGSEPGAKPVGNDLKKMAAA